MKIENNKSLRIACILLLVLFFSCNNSKNRSLSQKEVEMLNLLDTSIINNIDQVNISNSLAMEFRFADLDKKKVSVSQIIDTAWHVNLEYTKEALYNFLYSVDIKDSLIFAFIGRANNELKLCVFNMDGKYLYDIGKHGMGPKEYVRLSGFTIYKDRVILFDDPQSRLLFFKLDGTFLSEKKVPFRFKDLKYLNDTTLIFNLGIYNEHLTALNGYDIVLTDSLFNPKKVACKTNRKDSKFNLEIGSRYFAEYDENIFFRPYFTDTVYRASKNGNITGFVKFDLGKQSLTVAEKDKELVDMMDYVKIQDKILQVDPIYVSKDYLIFDLTFCTDRRKGLCLLNLNSGKSTFFSPLELIFDTSFLLTPASVSSILCVLDDNIIVTTDQCNKEVLKDILDQLPLDRFNDNLKETYLKETEGNGIITFIKLKDEIQITN